MAKVAGEVQGSSDGAPRPYCLGKRAAVTHRSLHLDVGRLILQNCDVANISTAGRPANTAAGSSVPEALAGRARGDRGEYEFYYNWEPAEDQGRGNEH